MQWQRHRIAFRLNGHMRSLHLHSHLHFLCSAALVLLNCMSSFAHCAQETAAVVEIASPAKGDSFAPRILADGDGMIFSWIESIASTEKGKPSTHRVCMSRFSNGAWSAVGEIAAGDDLFANWADTPTVVRTKDGTLLATWLRKSAVGTYIYDAVASRSVDDGKTWTLLGPLHDDGKPAEHGFVSAQTEGAATMFCWLDGRAMEQPDAESHDHGGGGDMSLRAARVAPTTQRVSPPSEILDERTCECCPTDLAIGKNGPIIVYRDRGEDGTRDISLVRWLGEGWSQPQPIGKDGWMLNGCPVNGPSISASGDDVIVAWWTGEPTNGAVRAVRSNNGGATFGPPLNIDTDGSFGRVETILLPSGDACILWYDRHGDDGSIALKRLSQTGALGATHTLAKVSGDRSSGFPRAALQGMDIWIACTVEGAGEGEGEDKGTNGTKSRRVKLLRVPIAALP